MSIWLGVGLALCSTACSATGYTLQKIAHNRHDRDLRAMKKVPSRESGQSTESDTPVVIVESDKRPETEVQGERSGESRSLSPSHVTGPVFCEPTDLGTPRTHELSPNNIVSEDKSAKPRSYLMYWQFPAGLLLLITGTVFAAFVFGLAPQSTLAPLGSVTMILNTILSWKFLGEAFTRVDAISILLMAGGTTVAVLFGKAHDPKYTCVCLPTAHFLYFHAFVWLSGCRLSTVVHLFVSRPAAWALASSAAVAMTAATAYVYTVGRKPIEEMKPHSRRIDVFCRAFLGAAWSGYSNFASKAVVEVAFASVANRSAADWRRPELYLLGFIMIGSLIMQVKFLNVGLSKYDSMIVVRLYQAMLAIFSILSGFFYFDEISRLNGFAIGMFCLGVSFVLAGMGVGMLKRLKTGKLDPEPVIIAAPAVGSPLLTDAVIVPNYATCEVQPPSAERPYTV